MYFKINFYALLYKQKNIYIQKITYTNGENIDYFNVAQWYQKRLKQSFRNLSRFYLVRNRNGSSGVEGCRTRYWQTRLETSTYSLKSIISFLNLFSRQRKIQVDGKKKECSVLIS